VYRTALCLSTQLWLLMVSVRKSMSGKSVACFTLLRLGPEMNS